jgi:hypothetical protein
MYLVLGVWCGIPPTAYPFSLTVQYHLLKIVAAVAALGRLGEGLIWAADRCPSSAFLPLPSCTHSSSMLGVAYCQHTRFVPMSSFPLLWLGKISWWGRSTGPRADCFHDNSIIVQVGVTFHGVCLLRTRAMERKKGASHQSCLASQSIHISFTPSCHGLYCF